MAGGAAITVITKSGTNKFRGSGVRVLQQREAERHAVLRDGQERRRARTSTARRWADQSGGTSCSSSAHGKGSTRRTPQQFFYNVPPAALRPGDFSQAFNTDGSLQVIYDPRTGNPDGTGRLPFPGNVIPAEPDRLHRQKDPGPVSRCPNAAGSTSGGNVGGAASLVTSSGACRARSTGTTTI